MIINLLLIVPLLFASTIKDLRRVCAHIKVGDSSSSIIEARKAIERHPETSIAYEVMIQALAHSNESGELIDFWERFHEKFPEEAMSNRVLEEVCWSILRQGKHAHTLSSRLIGVIGAALTQDAYGIDFLIAGMQDSNAHIRSVAVELSTLLKDAPLQDEIVRLLKHEKRREVKIGVIKAVGALKLKYLYADLIEIVEDKRSSALERAAAVSSILEISDRLERPQLEKLVLDRRAGLRLLACESIVKFEMHEYADLLFRLINDSSPQVAAAALRAVGLLRIEGHGGYSVVDFVAPLAQTLDSTVGITASWVLLLHDKQKAEAAFSHWIFHEKPQVRCFAAAAIAASGAYGVHSAMMFLDKTTDQYVRANLAMGLIGQRVNSELACSILDDLLSNSNDKWMQDEGIFPALQRSNLSHRPGITNYPEVVNQTVRLELLNLLAIMDYPGAHDAIRNFLKERRYGVTGLAAETLLGEGDESAIELVREILDDEDKEIRLDAALVLATWGRDPSAIPILLEVYPKADRVLKIKILESLGRIGDRSTLPFLIQRLKEPSQNIRLIAASVLIQTLNQ